MPRQLLRRPISQYFLLALARKEISRGVRQESGLEIVAG